MMLPASHLDDRPIPPPFPAKPPEPGRSSRVYDPRVIVSPAFGAPDVAVLFAEDYGGRKGVNPAWAAGTFRVSDGPAAAGEGTR